MLNNFSLVIFKFQYTGLELVESETVEILQWHCSCFWATFEAQWMVWPFIAIPQLTCFTVDDKNTSWTPHCLACDPIHHCRISLLSRGDVCNFQRSGQGEGPVMSGLVFPVALGLLWIPQRELIEELWRLLQIQLPTYSPVRKDSVGISISLFQHRKFPSLNVLKLTFSFTCCCHWSCVNFLFIECDISPLFSQTWSCYLFRWSTVFCCLFGFCF